MEETIKERGLKINMNSLKHLQIKNKKQITWNIYTSYVFSLVEINFRDKGDSSGVS